MGYFRNVIQIEILSSEPLGDEIEDLSRVDYEEEVSAERMRELLIAQRSDPDYLVDAEGT